MPPTSSADPQRRANDRLWARRSLVKHYANRVLRPVEALHYISRAAQESQLTAHGFEYVECLAADGRRVDAGDDAPDEPWLHYVARRGPGQAA